MVHANVAALLMCCVVMCRVVSCRVALRCVALCGAALFCLGLCCVLTGRDAASASPQYLEVHNGSGAPRSTVQYCTTKQHGPCFVFFRLMEAQPLSDVWFAAIWCGEVCLVHLELFQINF